MGKVFPDSLCYAVMYLVFPATVFFSNAHSEKQPFIGRSCILIAFIHSTIRSEVIGVQKLWNKKTEVCGAWGVEPNNRIPAQSSRNSIPLSQSTRTKHLGMWQPLVLKNVKSES